MMAYGCCRLTSTQFSLDEMRAIVEEAAAVGTYVCAHACEEDARNLPLHVVYACK